MDYPAEIVRLAGDPRTGIVEAFPMGLPNIGQIKQFLDDKLAHREKLQRLAELPKFEPQRRLPRPPAPPGAFANVFVPIGTPMYARFVERAKTADCREYRYEKGRDGIFVSLAWFDQPSQEAKHFKHATLSDDDLRKLYPKQSEEMGQGEV
jgi:hypothetical protein